MNSVDALRPLKISGFSLLDTDVLVYILCLLQPLDVIRCRQTCRWLHQLTFVHSIWITAINRIVPRYQLQCDVAPLSNLSTRQLEEAALRPYRFQKNISRSNPTVKLVAALDRPKEQNVYARLYKLLPGGRWLLTSDNLGALKLFDLRVRDGTMQSVAECHLEGEIQDLHVQALPDGTGATILVDTLWRQDTAPHPEDYHVVCLDLSKETPVFKEQPGVLAVGRTACTTVFGELVASTTVQGSVICWNWVTDEWVEMVDPERVGRNHDLRVKLNGRDSVTTFDMLGGAARTYQIPPLRSRKGEQYPLAASVRGAHVQSSQPLGLFSSMLQPDSWQHDSQDSVVLASARQLVFYTSKTLDPVPQYDVAARVTWTRSYLSAAHKASVGRTIDGSSVVMTNSAQVKGPSELEIHVVNGGSRSSFQVPLPWPGTSPNPAAWKVLFCPISGIVCMIPYDGAVHIFDLASS